VEAVKKGYWLVTLTVQDAEGYQRYRDAIGDSTSSFGARYLTRGERAHFPEGPGQERNIIVEFESYETALACYNSPAYQAALVHRLASSIGYFAIVEGA